MQKLTISIACSVGLHTLLLLYWHIHETCSQQEPALLNSHKTTQPEPVQFILQPSPQQADVSQQTTQSEAQPPSRGTPLLPEPEPAQSDDGAVEPVIRENIADTALEAEDISLTDRSIEQTSPQTPAPDLFSIRQQIQQHTPLAQDGSDSARCQQDIRLQGMAVDCPQNRYARAATIEQEEMSLAAQTAQRLTTLLNGPEAVPPAREFDASDTSNRINANRNLVGDQLQGNQLRKAIMNQR